MVDGSKGADDGNRVLRRGWTTGACAAAAARAAYSALLTGAFPDPVTITLPGGARPEFPLALQELGSGVSFRAGAGVGTVTRPGLALAVGEPAINPGPRALIDATLREVASSCGGASPDVSVTLSIPGGEELSAKTLNGRLGIVGGLSILGTTGIVIPYSCAAWLHSIHRGIDVARAAGLTHIAAAAGSTSEAAVQRLHGLPDTALIDMGDFVGGTLKYLR